MGSEWREVTIGDIATIKHGFAFKGEYFADEPQSSVLLTPGNFAVGGGFQSGKPKYYLGPIPADYVLAEGDLVVTMTDLSKASDTLGYAARVPKTIGITYLHNQRTGLVQVKDSQLVRPEWLHYLMRTQPYRSWVVGSASGTTVKHTSPSRIGAYAFCLPPVEAQISAASTLDAIESRIDLLRQTNATLESIAQALFKSWFVDFDPVHAKAEGREPAAMDAATAAMFPNSLEEWSRTFISCKIQKLIDSGVIVIGDGFRAKNSELGTPGVYFLRAGDLVSGHVTPTRDLLSDEVFAKVKNKCAEAGDTVFTSKGTIGRFALVPKLQRPLVYSPQVCFWRSRDQSRLTPEYLHFWMRGSRFAEQVDCVRGNAAIMDFVSLNDQKSMMLDIPDPSLQAKFSDIVAPLMKRVEINRSLASCIENLRDTLLPRLISGKLRLPEAMLADSTVLI